MSLRQWNILWVSLDHNLPSRNISSDVRQLEQTQLDRLNNFWSSQLKIKYGSLKSEHTLPSGKWQNHHTPACSMVLSMQNIISKQRTHSYLICTNVTDRTTKYRGVTRSSYLYETAISWSFVKFLPTLQKTQLLNWIKEKLWKLNPI